MCTSLFEVLGKHLLLLFVLYSQWLVQHTGTLIQVMVVLKYGKVVYFIIVWCESLYADYVGTLRMLVN